MLAKKFTSISFARLSAIRREMSMVQRRGTEPGQYAAASKYLGISLTMAASTGLFLYVGMRADRWLGTDPWLTLIGGASCRERV